MLDCYLPINQDRVTSWIYLNKKSSKERVKMDKFEIEEISVRHFAAFGFTDCRRNFVLLYVII